MRKLTIVAIVGLLLCISVAPVVAQGSYPPGVVWNTPFVIQNMGDSQAQVTVSFYDIETGAEDTDARQTYYVDPGRAQPVRPWQISGLADGKYSVVIASTQPVAAVVNEQDVPGGNSRAMSYATLGSGGRYVYFPNIIKNYYGWNTPFYIQNAGQSSVTVTIRFYKFSDGTEVTAAQKTGIALEPGRSYEYDPTSDSTLPSNAQYSVMADAGSGGLIVGIVNELLTNGSVEMSYSGFTSGGTKVYLPNITKTYYGWDTPFIIQNIDNSATAELTVEFYDFSTGALVYTVSPKPQVGPRQSYAGRPWQIGDGDLPTNKQYSVVVTSNSPDIVGVVNEQAPRNNSSQAMSYNGFNSGSASVYLPNITKTYYQWDTPIVVQNVGSGTANVSCKFYDFTTGAEQPGAEQINSIGPGRSWPIRPWQISDSDLPTGKQYSVVCTATGSDIVAVINEQWRTNTSVDQAMSYEGINKTE